MASLSLDRYPTLRSGGPWQKHPSLKRSIFMLDLRSRRQRHLLWALALTAPFGWLGLEIVVWPDVGALASTNPSETAFTRRSARPVSFVWVPYTEIADTLKHAVLVAEDINFFSHEGFEMSEVRGAIREALASRRLPRGASTLTQQLAKNLWLSPARSPRRKIREALLTWQLETTLSKRRILEVYLNVVEFGDGVFGCEPASRRFFGKSAATLSSREAARLAAVLPRPGSWSPDGSDPRFLAAVDRIERRMQRSGWLRGVL